jgi:hypothetical protein
MDKRAHPAKKTRFSKEAQSMRGCGLPYDRALTAEELVLDDLGAELAGAPENSGLIAQRAEPAITLLSERYDRRTRGRLVITTPIGADLPAGDTRPLRRALASYYGDGVAGRIYEHAAVVRVGGGATAGAVAQYQSPGLSRVVAASAEGSRLAS